MGPIGLPELLVVLFLVLVLFGPGKLPDIGNAIGKGIREFRKASSDLEDGLRGEARRKPQPPSPAADSGAAPAPTDTDSSAT